MLLLAAPVLILALVLAVPIGYRYLWPVPVKRPKLFLLITLGMGVIVAAVAMLWFFSALLGSGFTGTTPGTAASQAVFDTMLRNRLLVAAAFAALVEYLLCRITQTIMGM